MGLPQVDTSVLLAAGLPTASAVACQGSINFLLEESVHTTEWIHFSQGQLSAQASALGGCRGQGGTPPSKSLPPGPPPPSPGLQSSGLWASVVGGGFPEEVRAEQVAQR